MQPTACVVVVMDSLRIQAWDNKSRLPIRSSMKCLAQNPKNFPAASKENGGVRRVNRAKLAQTKGFTLIELIVATAILVVLTGLAVPLARVTIKREKEHELRHDLWEMRDAIDRYKDAADRGAFQIKVGTEGYPPDLQTLVDGVDVGGKKVRF